MNDDDARLAAEIVDALSAPSEADESASRKLESTARIYVENHGLVSDGDCLIAAVQFLATIYPENAELLRRVWDQTENFSPQEETTFDAERAMRQLLHIILLYVSAFGSPRVPRTNLERLLRKFPRCVSTSRDRDSITFTD
jgi:hypothetical protein